jgi:predicted secreted hydrolase
MSRRVIMAMLGAVVAVVAGLAYLHGTDEHYPPQQALQVASLLGDADAAGLRLADPSYRLRFPQDHGDHPDFRSEWWYFTGNVEAGDGRRFGFQFTIFRFALGGAPIDRSSRWATRQAWMGHLAVTDVDGGRFFRAERLARGGRMGLAGATQDPFRVWIDSWRMASLDAPFLPLGLSAQAEDFGLALRVLPGRGPVLQGDKGFSRKGPGPGNASYYYSYTRLPVVGELNLAGELVPVKGEAWLDREWGTSTLGPNVRGWDWFALQLDDGSELMYYQLRLKDGQPDPLSAGTLTAPTIHHVDASGVELAPGRRWTSPETGARYPVSWEISVPSESLHLKVEAVMDAQEMALSVNYWEGAVRVTGARLGVPVEGRGYLEMTGYDGGDVNP